MQDSPPGLCATRASRRCVGRTHRPSRLREPLRLVATWRDRFIDFRKGQKFFQAGKNKQTRRYQRPEASGKWRTVDDRIEFAIAAPDVNWEPRINETLRELWSRLDTIVRDMRTEPLCHECPSRGRDRQLVFLGESCSET